MSKHIDLIAAELARLPEKADVRTRALRVAKEDPRQEEDSAYRAAYGVRGKKPYGTGLRAAYWTELPPPPSGAYVGRDAARAYVGQIDRVIDIGGWAKGEREKLRVMRLKWIARAEGRDARFNAMGVQGGLTDSLRPKRIADILGAIREAIAESAGVPAPPARKFLTDPGWPFGRPNPDRRAT